MPHTINRLAIVAFLVYELANFWAFLMGRETELASLISRKGWYAGNVIAIIAGLGVSYRAADPKSIQTDENDSDSD